MPKKILINGTTLNGGNITPLLIKARVWQRAGNTITFFGDKDLERQIQDLEILEHFDFIYLPKRRLFRTRFGFIFEALKQNFLALKVGRSISEKYDVIYNISSVLDMILCP